MKSGDFTHGSGTGHSEGVVGEMAMFRQPRKLIAGKRLKMSRSPVRPTQLMETDMQRFACTVLIALSVVGSLYG